jgi:hypothetical protein
VVIRVAAQAVREQVAVVVPGVRLPIDAGRAIGRVVLIVYHAPTRCQAQAIAHGVVGVDNDAGGANCRRGRPPCRCQRPGKM